MPVPDELKPKSHVFCYSSDLIDAAKKLAEYLDCNVSTVYADKVSLATGAESSKVAWLVGHGAVTDTWIYNQYDKPIIKIREICDWLEGNSYDYIVDTCCYPKTRIKWQTFGSSYYSSKPDQCVYKITGSDSFDDWWDESNMQESK